MQKIFHFFRFGLLATVAITATRCNEKTQAATNAADNAIAVTVQPVKDTSYAPVLKYSGLMASTSEARLSFKTGGIISKIHVREGDRVHKGQLLAALDMTEIDAQVQQAQVQVEKTRRDVERVKNLYTDTVATLEQLQNTTTQWQVAAEGLRIAHFNRRFAQIRATENGTVLRKMMNEGELATAGTPVFLLNGASNSDWVIRFGVADKDWAVLKKGDKAEVAIDAYPGKSFPGIITEIARGADPASGTYEVEVKVLPNGARFAAGLFASVQLQPAARQSLSLIPIEAIAEADGKTGYVYTLNTDNKSVTRHLVTIAYLEKDIAAVSSGLENIHHVITGGVGYLTENALVQLVSSK